MKDKDKTQSRIKVSSLSEYSIHNYKDSKKVAYVMPLSLRNSLTNKNIEEIVSICNQELVYKLLFKEKLNGKKYKADNAKSFITWANNGWEKRSHFAFMIMNHGRNVIGAIDIKTNNPDFGEIGYWMSEDYPGYMTNAVSGLIEIARKAGYRKLIGYTKLKNDKSKGVLTRNGFVYIGQEERKPGFLRDKYEIIL